MINYAINLYLPLTLSSVLHMLVVKFNLMAFLKIPVATGLFGKNKTWRGFLFVTFATGGAFLVTSRIDHQMNAFLLGGILGFTYVLFELPNSFVKRRLGIQPGAKAQTNKLLFLILDKTDSTFGVSLVYSILFKLELVEFLFLFLLAAFIHLMVSIILVKVKIKESL